MLNFFKLYKLPIMLVGFLLYTVLMLFAGWQIHTYYDGYKENEQQKIQKIVDNGISQIQRTQAQGLEDTKAALKNAATNTIIKEPTIINRPIYMNKCFDQDGVDNLQQFKADSIKAREHK